MSVDYSAKMVYGVLLTADEFVAVKENKLLYEDALDNGIIHYADHYDGPHDDSVIIGVCIDSVSEAEDTEVCVTTPTGNEVDAILDFLDIINVDREPTWHLLCEVS